MPCPLDPTIQLHGIVPSACTVFKSSLSPIKLVFNVAGDGLPASCASVPQPTYFCASCFSHAS